FFFFQAEDGIRDPLVTGVQTCALPILTLSGHKIGGPKGIGALVGRAQFPLVDALIKGGGQERGLRAGTENVAGIAGFGAAAAAEIGRAACRERGAIWVVGGGWR